MNVLDIGSGPLRQYFGAGYDVTRLDVDPSVSPNICQDWHSLPFPDGHFDVVYASHSLEHNPSWEIVPLLHEWSRVLTPDGMLILSVPSLEWAATQILAGVECADVWCAIYGGEGDHRTGFTERTLRELCGPHADITAWRNSWNVRVKKSDLVIGEVRAWSVSYVQMYGRDGDSELRRIEAYPPTSPEPPARATMAVPTLGARRPDTPRPRPGNGSDLP